MRKVIAGILFLIASFSFVGAAATQVGATDSNHVSYWCAQGVKYEPVDTPFVVPSPPSGYTWTKLVLKAGSGQNGDENTVVNNPLVNQAYYNTTNPNNQGRPRNISHVILCKTQNQTTTTTTQPEETTTTTTEPEQTTSTTVEETTTTTQPEETTTTTEVEETTTTVAETTTTVGETTTTVVDTTTTVADGTTTTSVAVGEPPVPTDTAAAVGERSLPVAGGGSVRLALLGAFFVVLGGLTLVLGRRPETI